MSCALRRLAGQIRQRLGGHPHALAGKGSVARQKLVEHAADAEHIGSRIDGATAGLLRRHVAGRAHDPADLGVDGLGDAEVDDLHPAAAIDQDECGGVLGL